jgi:uncharacterized protein with PIN domain
MEIVVTPFAERHWEAATEAFTRFGKGSSPGLFEPR